MQLIYTIITIIIIVCVLSYVLLVIQISLENQNNNPESILINNINDYLPQTQCGQCNYPGCKPYATAISKLQADINLCPPGGQKTVDNLAQLLNIPSIPIVTNRSNNNNSSSTKLIAQINETECIGCLLCIKACPVSAIVGANKLMHTVIIDQCTGCELCVAPCPMDCISMIELA